MSVRSYDVDWTAEKVAEFWEYYYSEPSRSAQMFEYQVGKNIVAFALRHADLSGHILNYGSGLGYLVEYLLEEECTTVSGCDFSEQSVERLCEKFGNHPRFGRGIWIEELPSILPAEHYDVVFLLETVEHLISDTVSPTINEISRVLKPGGKVICSTRNNENLNTLKNRCPDCGCVFHRVQHVSSFTEQSLSALFTEHGFSENFCKGVEIKEYWNRTPVSVLLRRLKRRILSQVEGSPHLLYIGEKNQA